MAVTITWKINEESHVNDSEKYIYNVKVEVKGTETVNSENYESIENFYIDLDKPDTLIAYDTFNKQSTLVASAKTKMGATDVTGMENKVKSNISKQQNTISYVLGVNADSSVPPD